MFMRIQSCSLEKGLCFHKFCLHDRGDICVRCLVCVNTGIPERGLTAIPLSRFSADTENYVRSLVYRSNVTSQ